MSTPDPLAPLREAPTRTAVLLDFDGSLAPIVDDPPSARPIPEAVPVLAELVEVTGCTGVVSGRPASFLRRVLPVPGLVLAGLYGMERVVDGDVVLDEAVQPFVGVAEAAASEAERLLRGLFIERKGEVSCVIHWRRAPDRELEALEIGREIADRHGLAAEPSRMALELRPPVDVNKGSAFESITEGMQAAMFAGDDQGDLKAFDAIDRMMADGRLRWGVKVAVRSVEAPVELIERADERVKGPEELITLLASLAVNLRAAH